MSACPGCDCRTPLNFGIKMAFQPIVDASQKNVVCLRSVSSRRKWEGAGEVLGPVTEDTKYTFDQSCRVKAIETASRIELPSKLSALTLCQTRFMNRRLVWRKRCRRHVKLASINTTSSLK